MGRSRINSKLLLVFLGFTVNRELQEKTTLDKEWMRSKTLLGLIVKSQSVGPKREGSNNSFVVNKVLSEGRLVR